MAKTNVQGHTGILKMAGAPIVCLTSSSYSLTANTIEKVTMCTLGKTETKIQSISKEVQIEGEYMTEGSSLPALRTAMKAKLPLAFALSGRGAADITFNAIITSLSDNFAAGEDVTFSATLVIQPPVI